MRLGMGDRGQLSQIIRIASAVILLVVVLREAVGVLEGRGRLPAKQQELADARLMSSLVTEFRNGRRLLQGSVGLAGDTLPEPIAARLKRMYTLTDEPDKKPLRRATAAGLRADLGIDTATAAFILANRDAPSIDALLKRKRNLLDQNRATIEPLIVQRISAVAGQSGIQKLDQLKVEPPKRSRRAASTSKAKKAVSRPDTMARANLIRAVRRIQAALEQHAQEALTESLTTVSELVRKDPTLEETARSELAKLLDGPELSPVEAAQVRLVALECEPTTRRVLSSVLRAHLEATLARFPAEPKATDDEEQESSEQADQEGHEPAERAEESPQVPDAGPQTAETGIRDATPEDRPADGSKNVTDEEAPVTYVSPPFPPLIALPRSVQRRLLETLYKNGGAWLTDEEIGRILNGEPAEADESASDGKESSTTEALSGPESPSPPKESRDKASETTEAPKSAARPTDPNVQRIRDYQAALVGTLWRLGDLVRRSASDTSETYTATVQFKGHLDQVVNLIYRLESESPWLHVTGIRITIEKPDEPLLSFTLSLDATIFS